MGVTRFIPTVLLWALVLVGVGNFLRLQKQTNAVLGAQTNLPYSNEINYDARLKQLKELSTRVDSEQLRNEIERLLKPL